MSEKSKKISTADCKDALIGAFPAAYGTASGDWKRVSKTGSGRIERLFLHRTLPLKGVVVEDKGAIISTDISLILPWEEEADTLCEKDEGLYDRLDSGGEFLAKHVSPSMFAFVVFESEDLEEGSVCAVITPLSYFQRIGAQYDGELDVILGDLVADGGEATEGSFVFEGTVDEVRAALLARGFVEDADFVRFMTDPSSR